MSTETLPLFSFILILGVVTSFEDIRTRKIKNKWIAVSAGFVFLFYAFVFLTDETMRPDIRRDILRDMSINGFISLCAGYALWKASIWPPGDAKLFFAYALLVPLPLYNNGYLPYFPSLALLINIFAAGFIYVTLVTLFSDLKVSTLSQRMKNLMFKPKTMEPSKLKRFAGTLTQKFFGAMAMIILFAPLRESVLASSLSRYAFLLSLGLLFAYGYAQKFLIKTFKLWQLILFISLYGVSGFVTGNAPAFAKHISVVLKMSFMFMAVGEGAGRLLRMYIDYLGEEERGKNSEPSLSQKKIADYVASESGNSQSNIAFAPLMFCGVLTTIVMKQSVVHYVLQLFQNR